ncbi:MAG TPA: hypothetical protein VFB58_12745 [Chloroflexota bacterium]|nr:hypothetical protein [Chloroflexota bacterium]
MQHDDVTYDNGDVNHDWNSRHRILQDDWDQQNNTCTPYGPTYP